MNTPLEMITAQATIGHWWLAGGVEGIVRSGDAGESWEFTEIEGGPFPVAALACLGETALAGTIGAGVLRSTDCGRTWRTATFGLTSFEVTTIVWTSEQEVLAGTALGICRSPNEGRAWRPIEGTEGWAVDELEVDSNGMITVVTEDGRVFRSEHRSSTWSSG